MMGKGGATLADFHGNDSKIPAETLALVQDTLKQIQQGLFRVDIDEAQPSRSSN